MINYAKDRDKAFEQFVKDDDFKHITDLFEKYEMKPNYPSEETAKAAVYKAVQECTGIDPIVKALAREKCIALGYKPTMF